MATYLLIYCGAALVSLAGTYLAIRLAPLMGALDQPGPRKVHAAPTPRNGGLAIFLATTAVLAGAVLTSEGLRERAGRDLGSFLGLLGASALMLAVGLADDIRGLRARRKLMAQILAAAALCALGVRIESLGAGGLGQVRLGWMSWPATILWVVGITNSMNLIDGMDGLAAGISAITCAVIAAFSLLAGQLLLAALMLALLGALTGFLVFNFHPARVFLGDCGSLFLGFLLAGASVLGSTKTAATVALALPLLAMGVPVFDTLLSIFRRVLRRQSLAAPDREHIHHHLMRKGLSQRHIVGVLYGVTVLNAGLGMFMLIATEAGALLVCLCVLTLLGVFLRAVGALRFQGVVAAVRYRVRLSRERREGRRILEEARLRLREARSLHAWWGTIVHAAERMGTLRLRILQRDARGVERTVLSHEAPEWSGADETVGVDIPLPNPPSGGALRAAMDVRAEDSLEALGGRLMLFGRLIDESPPLVTWSEQLTDAAAESVDKESRRRAA